MRSNQARVAGEKTLSGSTPPGYSRRVYSRHDLLDPAATRRPASSASLSSRRPSTPEPQCLGPGRSRRDRHPSFTDRRYGFRGLELLAGGATPQAALDELRAPDTLAGFRQVGMMDAAGVTAQ